tara:strand:- start:331 stop:459 length:129 start_codon:yes stop_codon:yes gene_type:complete
MIYYLKNFYQEVEKADLLKLICFKYISDQQYPDQQAKGCKIF